MRTIYFRIEAVTLHSQDVPSATSDIRWGTKQWTSSWRGTKSCQQQVARVEESSFLWTLVVLVLNSATWPKYALYFRIRLWGSPVLSQLCCFYLLWQTSCPILAADITAEGFWLVAFVPCLESEEIHRNNGKQIKKQTKNWTWSVWLTGSRSRICRFVWVCCEKVDYPTSSEASPVMWRRPRLRS